MLDGAVGSHEAETPLLLFSLDFLPSPGQPGQQKSSCRQRHRQQPAGCPGSCWLQNTFRILFSLLCFHSEAHQHASAGIVAGTNPLPGALRSRHGKCSCRSDGDLKSGGKQLEDHRGLNTVRRRRRNSSSGCYLLGVSVRTCTRWAVQEHSGGGGKSTQGLFVW